MKTLATVLAVVLGLAPVAAAGPMVTRAAVAPRVSMPAVLPGNVVLPVNHGLSLSAPSLAPSVTPSLNSAVLTPAALTPSAPLAAAPAAAADNARVPSILPSAAQAASLGQVRTPLAALQAAANDAPEAPKGDGAESKPASAEQQGADAGKPFDGSVSQPASEDGLVAQPSAAELPRFGLRRLVELVRGRRPAANSGRPAKGKSADEEDQLDELGMFYAGTSARGLLDSHIWGDVKLIKPTEGSKWWWNKFKAGEDIRIKAGSEWLFYSKITDATTKPIGKLTKKDLEGIFSATDLGRHPISELRRAVADKLTKAHRDQFHVTLNTPVRLVHFKTPKMLDTEHEAGKPQGERYDPFAQRAALKLPADSPLRRLNQYFPKAVMVDLDAFGERIPPQLIEDMGKLQRAGVKFVFFSDRPGEQYKKQRAQILDGLYGSLFALDGGAQVVAHSRDQAHTRSADLLTEYDRSTLLMHAKAVAYENGGDANGVAEVLIPAPGGLKAPARTFFKGKMPANADAEKFRDALQARLHTFGLRGEVVLEPAGKAGTSRGFIIRHREMTESMGDVLRGLQSMGVYANPQEILVISENPKYAAALPKAAQKLLDEDQPGQDGKAARRSGALREAADAATLAGVPLKGEELVENALGAVLGEYRQNMRNDFVTSASALESFSHYTDRFFSQELIKGEENIYAFWGHESHDVMNWVAWVQRNTGRAPTEEEMVDRFRRQWEEAVHSPEFAVYLPPGRDLINVREAAVGRLKGMYQVYRRIMDLPGAELVGTEVPNIFVLKHFDRKTGETRRVFIRTIFDFAITVPSEGGRKLMMMDFKSGVKPTEEVLRKKIQPRTYRLFTTYKWASLPEQYDTAAGALKPVTGVELEFIYNRSAVPVHLHGWNDSQTELEILRVAERMRQDKQRTHLRPTRKRKAPAAGAKKPAAKTRAAAKKATEDAE